LYILSYTSYINRKGLPMNTLLQIYTPPFYDRLLKKKNEEKTDVKPRNPLTTINLETKAMQIKPYIEEGKHKLDVMA